MPYTSYDRDESLHCQADLCVRVRRAACGVRRAACGVRRARACLCKYTEENSFYSAAYSTDLY